MKLTVKERKVVEMLRRLDARQLEELLGQMRRQLIANRITVRVGRLQRLRIGPDKKIEKAFGLAPNWKLKVRTGSK